MNISPKFGRAALALLSVVTIGTAAARAQKGAEGKISAPPSRPTTQASPLPSPLPARPVADKLAPAGWTRYEVGEPARFSLILPAVPSVSAERMNITPGVSVTVRVYLSSTDSGVYGATYLEGLPAAAMRDDAKRAFFESFMTSFMDGFQAGVMDRGVVTSLRRLEQRAATADGLTGYEQDFSYERLMGRVRLVFDGGKAYAVMAVWNGLSSNSERHTFFESLRVTKTP
jgi:hypothetical protein